MCPDLNSLYRDIAKPMVGPNVPRLLQLPPPVPARHQASLLCLVQGCMNLAHAARGCSGPTTPPDQWRCLHQRNITETVADVAESALTPREHPRNQSRSNCTLGVGANLTPSASARMKGAVLNPNVIATVSNSRRERLILCCSSRCRR